MNLQPLIEKIANDGDYFSGANVTLIVALLIITVFIYNLIELIISKNKDTE